MAKGISIGVASDTREFTQGIKRGVIEPLEDAVDALDDVQRAGDKAGDELEQGFEKGRKSVSEFKRAQDRTWEELRSNAKRAGDTVGKEINDGTDKAKEGVDEFGREAQSTLKETGASFDGTAESGIDAIQEIAANALAGFGAAGVAIGLALAATIGIAIGEGQKAADAINLAKERAGELANELGEVDGDLDRIDLGAKFRDWGVEIADTREFFEIWQDSAKTNLDLAAEAAKRAGGDFTTFFRAMSGLDAKAAERALADIDEQIQKNSDRIEKLRADNPLASIFSAGAIAGIDDTNDALLRNQLAIEKATGVTADAIEMNELLTEATEKETAAAEANALAEERRADAVATLDSAYDDAAGAVEDYLNEESGLFDPAAYITAMQAKEQALRDYQTTLAASPLSESAKSFLDAQGAESAATFLAGYKSATPAQQRELERIWDEAGTTSSGSYTAALKAGIPATLPGPVISPSVDLTAARRTLTSFSGEIFSAKVGYSAELRPGTRNR